MMKLNYLVFTIMFITNIFESNCQGIIPSQAEQVNLLTTVQSLFEEMKSSALIEQKDTDQQIDADINLSIKLSTLFINVLKESTITQLKTKGNRVCFLDAIKQVEKVEMETLIEIANCSKNGKVNLAINSKQLQDIMDVTVTTVEDFLDKLNRCSEKRGLAVIACYKKILQEDVTPTRTVLMRAINNHEFRHTETTRIKESFNECIVESIDQFRNSLDLTLELGLNCT